MSQDIIGNSKVIHELISMIDRVATTKTSILIIGESGTGKELVAQMIHDRSPLSQKSFIPINCGAIPENLIESELFGHKKGSFTGAVSDKMGLFESANGGTLFLDEIGELPLSMQVKLLRALQDRKIRRVGGNEDRSIDVRIIAATNRDLEEGIRKGTFREDLYYRLNVIQIKTPPLRDREGDVVILAHYFLQKCAEKQGKAISGFEDQALQTLVRHPWPGNVRELENVIERAVTLVSSHEITMDVLPISVAGDGSEGDSPVIPGTLTADAQAEQKRSSSPTILAPEPNFDQGPIDLDVILGNIEKAYLNQALLHAGGVKKKAADLLGITFRSIRYRLKKLGVESDEADDSDHEGV